MIIDSGVTRRLCIVDAGLRFAGGRWFMSDLDSKALDLDPPRIEGDEHVLPARETFRYFPWFYAGDTLMEEKGSIRMRITGGGSSRGEMMAGISLRGTADDWKPYRTAHVSLLFTADRRKPDESSVSFDDMRGPGPKAVATAKGWKVPLWLRIDRDGNRYTGFASQDGSDWTQIGVIDGPRRNLGNRVMAGIAAGTNERGGGTLRVDNVTIR